MQAHKALLVILDGWGLGQDPAADAIAQASTPVFDALWANYPHSTLTTFGEEVGLPEGQMGNSEVGHLNIGAGRVVYQELARINKAIRDGELANNDKLLAAIDYAKEHNKNIHLIGLLSDGGVHSHTAHVNALVDIIAAKGHTKTCIHAFTDGRDTDPQSGKGFLQDLLAHLAGKPAQLASVVGRYFAMDRDKRWERVKLAYDLLVKGEGERTADIAATMDARYAAGETDEFIQPIVVTRNGADPAFIEAGDVVISFNFRTDRPRQITAALTQMDFPEYGMHALGLHYVTMTRYDEKFQGLHVMFEKDDLSATLGEVLSKAGKTQVRIAETEKYPHVTFFFNGGREEPFDGERRLLVASPKEVATYDLKPEMSAPGITEAIIADIKANAPDFICLNYANADMVGHTGSFQAAMQAVETVDTCLGQLIEVARAHGYEAIVIADHGNSDYMINADGSPNTAHTMNPVPCIYVHQPETPAPAMKDGKLGDIAPTILRIMGVAAPAAMDGEVLFV